MGGRVAVLDPEGKFATVDEGDVDKLPLGARVLTAKEQAAQRAEESYQAQPTWKKVATVATMAGPIGYIPHVLLRGEGGQLPPELEAYVQGVSGGYTGGLASVGMEKLVGAAGGSEAAKAYARTAEDVKKAHGELYSAGQLAGFIGGASSSPIGAVGGLAEQGVVRGVGGLAARGVLGRAGATALSLGARGATEGALYGAAEQVSDDMLGDHELAADKVFAAAGLGALGGLVGGAALGGAGSLIGSGVRGGLARLAPKAEEAAAALTKEGTPISKLMGGRTEEAVRDVAYDRAFRATGGRKAFVEQTKRLAELAEDGLKRPGGTAGVGEALLRHGVINAEDGVANAALHGTPASIAERIEAPLASVGERLGEITEASGAKIAVKELDAGLAKVIKPLEQSAATLDTAKSVRRYVGDLVQTLGITSLDGEVSVQSLLRERKALDVRVYQETKALDPNMRVGALRDIRGEMEDLITKALDKASGDVPGKLRGEYNALKHDYQALSIAKAAADDAAVRGSANRTFSLTDKIIGSAVGGAAHIVGIPGLVAGPMAAGASKLIRERGDAAAAVLLHRMAESASLAKLMARVDETIGKAAKGVLEEPKAIPLPEGATSSARVRATDALKRVADMQANPEALADKATRLTERTSTTAPMFAGALTRRFTDAAAFLASKRPGMADPDPFDPHPAPRFNDQQAHEFAEYAKYADRPSLFFEEASHGKLTWEGVETAKALMPRAFAEFQQRVIEQYTDMRQRGITPPYRQAQRLGVLLDVPLLPEQRPDMMRLLQSNVVGSEQAAKAGPKRPLPTKTPGNPLDRFELKGS